ncbi:MAG: ATP-binding protein [Actinomycetota bacterium]
MDSHGEALFPYRLRAVQLGIRTTILIVPTLLAFMILPHDPPIDSGMLLALLVLATIGVGTVAALPWRRAFETGWGTRLLTIWSIVDMVLIAYAVAVTGGGGSDLYLLFLPTSVFFATSYPVRAQRVLFAVTIALYLVAVVAAGEAVPVGNLVFRIAILAITSLLASFMSLELMEEMESHAAATDESRRRAQRLALVAAAARNMSELGPDHVLRTVVASAIDLGLEAANLCLIDSESATYRVLNGIGLPDDYEESVHSTSMGLVALALEAQGTIVVEDYLTHPRAVPRMRDEGFRCALASPIQVGGEIAAVLAGGSRSAASVSPEDVEAFELLAAQAGRALENASRFEEERRTVARLEDLDRLKSDFLSTVSHEVRTPLTAIEGLGVTLEHRWGRLGEAEKLDLLNRLNANVRSLEDIVSKLLDFSRLEAGKFSIEPEPVPVRHRAAEVLARLSSLLDAHRIELTVDRRVRAHADPLLLDRVLENLIANAAKYTPAGTTIRITARPSAENVCIEVADDGPGIPAAELSHLGERFYRGGDLNARRVRGTGLGLALVKEILELHSSRLEITSEVGRGSTFAFSLVSAETCTLTTESQLAL